METQWPLVIFTLFVCLTCGTLGGMSILALKGEGKNLQMTALITSAVSLVVGGIGAFLHLEHWERIFNGFGHITSGITQELIGCVALAIIIVVWFVMLRGEKPVSKALAWVTIVVAVLMVAATAHSYYMPARPAWGLALVVFYLGNACLLGAVAIWLISILKKDEAAEERGNPLPPAPLASIARRHPSPHAAQQIDPSARPSAPSPYLRTAGHPCVLNADGDARACTFGACAR